MSDLFQTAVIAMITLAVLWHVFKGGRANPLNTGAIGQEVSGLTNKLTGLSGRMTHFEHELEQLKREAATTEDVQQLEKLIGEKFNTIDAKMDGQQRLSQSTNRNVQRIYDIMLEKGLGK